MKRQWTTRIGATAAALVALGMSATACGTDARDAEATHAAASSPAVAIGSDDFRGKTVGDIKDALWSPEGDVDVKAFSTNTITSIVLGKGSSPDPVPVQDDFLVAAIYFCQPEQAFVYAVDPKLTEGKWDWPGYAKWNQQQLDRKMCADGTEPLAPTATMR
nr:hypothetical protein [Gordonia sp. LAM0048]